MRTARVFGEGLRAWCQERPRHEAVPEHWYILEEVPRSARGKISRDAARRLLAKEGP